MNAQQAGWHPDPGNGSQMRYWNGVAWTEHTSPRPVALPGPIPQAPTGNWYIIVPLVSCGLLASVPFFHAGHELRRPKLHVVGAGFAAASLLGFVLVGEAPTESWRANLGTAVILGVMLVATVLLVGLRREVYQSPRGFVAADPNESARARVEESRRKRNEARELALKDPMMARELRIGRPILGSTENYDDGGLVELNFATAEQLTTVCGLPPQMAAAVVEARTGLGRFQIVEDAITFGQISEDYAPLVRDRGIVIADRD